MTRIRAEFDPTLDGASFDLRPDDNGLPLIVIGNAQSWERLVGYVMHESMELAANLIQCRFEPSNDLGREASGYLFVMNHVQFSHVVAASASLLVTLTPKLKPVWKAHNGRNAN